MPNMTTDAITPSRRQYLAIKRQYPDVIVFFRMGDFYETFDDDAKLVSAELEIALTSREMGKGQRTPLAGFPYHSLETQLAKLISRGYKVAICEQVSDPVKSKGLVEREVVRVVTPGTVVEPQLLEAKENNYLAAVVVDGNRAGLAYADISVGEFAATEIGGEALRPLDGREPAGPGDEGALTLLRHELERLRPAECLYPGCGPRGEVLEVPWRAALAAAHNLTALDVWRFEQGAAREALLRHFGVASLEGFGCEGKPLAVRAAGALVQYLEDTQKAVLPQLTDLRTYSTASYMLLDAATRRNLELTLTSRTGSARGALISVLDHTVTAMGGRLLRQWLSQPLLDLARLQERQEAVGGLVDDGLLRAKVTDLLRKMPDLERLANRIAQKAAAPRDLLALKEGLRLLPSLQETLAGGNLGRLGERLQGQLDPCPELVRLIEEAIVPDPPPNLAEGGVIAPGFSAELDSLKGASQSARQWVASLEGAERERTGIRSLKVGYNKVFGYYLEVTNPNLEAPFSDLLGQQLQREIERNPALAQRQPPKTMREFLEVFCGYIRRQTLVGAERYITADLKEQEALILGAQERIVSLETAIFGQICEQVDARRQSLLQTARALAQLDALASLATAAARYHYVRPRLSEGDAIIIRDGRHPTVELSLSGESFVPNDVVLSNRDCQIVLLTGPNMAGKSTYILQVAVIVLMAQIGSYVPAREAEIGLVDRIFTRVGAQQDISGGQSTFMVEMAETAAILHHATPRSLVILDEIGRGTSTYDGMASARAVIEHLHNSPQLGCKTLFATHYHELTDLERYLPRVRNFRMDVLEEGDRVSFLRRVVPGGADRSYGVHVARLAGVPRAVTRRAEEVLEELERAAAAQRSREGVAEPEVIQLTMFLDSHPLVEELARLDVDSLTPLEALNKLYELRGRARAGRRGG